MGNINPKMWDDDRVRVLPPGTKLTWIYILTCQQDIPGLVRANAEWIASAIDTTADFASTALAELGASGLVEIDATHRLVRIPNAPKYNAPGNPNVVRGWFRRWGQLPDCLLKSKHVASIRSVVFGIIERAEERSRATWHKTWQETFAPFESILLSTEKHNNVVALKPFESLSKDTYPEQKQKPDVYLLPDPKSLPDPDAREDAHTPEGLSLAQYLVEAIRSHTPTVKATAADIGRWARDLELALRLDGRTSEQLRACVDYAHRDLAGSFWRSNILSGRKLREKFDTLDIQRQRPQVAKADVTVGHIKHTGKEIYEVGEVKL